MQVRFENPLFEDGLLRALSHSYYGGAEVGECLSTAERIPEDDAERWYGEWYRTAERIHAQAEASLAAGHRVSAREAFLRSSNYYRTAYLPLFGAPVDPRLSEALDRQTEVFQQAGALFSPRFESVSIPYEDTTLPGYFFTVDESSKPRPTLILTGGYDSTVEELYFFSAAAALRRGYNCLCFDGPGQGTVLLKQHLPFRPDWENVVRPVVDYALTRPEVDPARLALMGLSWGGYLAPRAATGEHRLAACIADPGQYDLLEALKRQIPLPPDLRDRLPNVDPALLQPILGQMMNHPRMAWAMKRAMLVHGVSSPFEYLRVSAAYTLAGLAQQITCPTLVCEAEDDPIAQFAPQLYEALTCPKHYFHFTNEEGAGEHCECGARTLFHQRAFDWLDDIFAISSRR